MANAEYVAVINSDLYDSTPTFKAILSRIAYWTRTKKKPIGWCTASQETLMNETGASRKTIYRAIRKFQDDKVATVKKHSGRRYTFNHYQLDMALIYRRERVLIHEGDPVQLNLFEAATMGQDDRRPRVKSSKIEAPTGQDDPRPRVTVTQSDSRKKKLKDEPDDGISIDHTDYVVSNTVDAKTVGRVSSCRSPLPSDGLSIIEQGYSNTPDPIASGEPIKTAEGESITPASRQCDEPANPSLSNPASKASHSSAARPSLRFPRKPVGGISPGWIKYCLDYIESNKRDSLRSRTYVYYFGDKENKGELSTEALRRKGFVYHLAKQVCMRETDAYPHPDALILAQKLHDILDTNGMSYSGAAAAMWFLLANEKTQFDVDQIDEVLAYLAQNQAWIDKIREGPKGKDPDQLFVEYFCRLLHESSRQHESADAESLSATV